MHSTDPNAYSRLRTPLPSFDTSLGDDLLSPNCAKHNTSNKAFFFFQLAVYLTSSFLIFILGVSREEADVTGPLSRCCFEISVTMALLEAEESIWANWVMPGCRAGARRGLECPCEKGQGGGCYWVHRGSSRKGYWDKLSPLPFCPGTFDTGPAQTTETFTCLELING